MRTLQRELLMRAPAPGSWRRQEKTQRAVWQEVKVPASAARVWKAGGLEPTRNLEQLGAMWEDWTASLHGRLAALVLAEIHRCSPLE